MSATGESLVVASRTARFGLPEGGDSMNNPDGRHAWLRLVPDKITSWDFRKMAG
jgi:hypothetical protein